MAEITAASVKELRERTGAGMMDCKKALAETNGEMEPAIDWLRAKGLAAAAKKAGRTAAEGLVGVAVESKRGAVVEINSETDFVAKNELFQDFVRNVAKLALEHGTDVEALGATAYPGGGTVAEKLTDNIAKIGENQSLRRAAVLDVSEGAIVSYVHNQVAPGLGKIGVLVALESAAPADTLLGIWQAARDARRGRPSVGVVAPKSFRPSWSSVSARSRWKRPRKAASRRTSSRRWSRAASPSSARRMRSSRQLFVIDNKTPVAEVVASAAKDAATGIVLKGFVRFQLGEGIEKKQEDFAAEVAAAAGTSKPEPVA